MQPHATDKTTAYATLRAVRGTPLTILLYLFVRGTTATQTWLVATTGYSPKTVRTALNSLHALGMVEHPAPHIWRLPAGQLPLPGFSHETGKKVPGFAPTTTTVIEAVLDRQHVVEEAPNREKLSLLQGAGIGEPMRTRIALLPHATLTYLKAHIRRARREHTDTGLLIHRLRSADPAPKTDRERLLDSWQAALQDPDNA